MPRWKELSILAAACALAASCAPTPPSQPLSLTELLEACAPLTSFDRQRVMRFSREHVVTVAPRTRAAGGRAAMGSWSGDEASRSLAVMLGGQTVRYRLYSPADDTFCILYAGSPQAVDLTGAWFSSLAESNDAALDSH